MKHRISVLILAVALAYSCSVKEDRSECPLYVSVKVQTASDCLVSFFAADGSLIERRLIAAEDMCTGNNTTEMKRTDFYVSILKDKWDMTIRDDQVVCCSSGREAAPVYAFSMKQQAFSGNSDELTLEGTLKKQHSLVSVRFIIADDSDLPCKMVISGARNGFDLVTLKGTEGVFAVEPKIDSSLCSAFVLTRQSAGDPIIMSLYNSTGVEKTEIDLSKYINRAGYDWNAENLGDIDIKVDYSQMKISVKISDWGDELIELF